MTDWEDVHGCENTFEFYEMLVATLPPKSRVLEMGVFYGKGLVYLAQNSDFQIYGVDQFKVADMPYQKDDINTDTDFYEACLKNVIRYVLESRIALIPMNSERASRMFPDHFFDCVFIDGKHDYDSAKKDIALWRDKVKFGGFMAGDDYVTPWGGVIQAVDEAFPERLLMGQTWYVQV